MDKRSEVLNHFGPKLIEGLALLVLDEINELRTAVDLPPRTKNQVFDQLTNHYSTLPDYDWMNQGN